MIENIYDVEYRRFNSNHLVAQNTREEVELIKRPKGWFIAIRPNSQHLQIKWDGPYQSKSAAARRVASTCQFGVTLSD